MVWVIICIILVNKPQHNRGWALGMSPGIPLAPGQSSNTVHFTSETTARQRLVKKTCPWHIYFAIILSFLSIPRSSQDGINFRGVWLYLTPWHCLERHFTNSGSIQLPHPLYKSHSGVSIKNLPCSAPLRCQFRCLRVTFRYAVAPTVVCSSLHRRIHRVVPQLFQVPVNLLACTAERKVKKKVSCRGSEWAKKVLCHSERVCKALNHLTPCLSTAPGRTGGAGGKRRSLGSSQAECLCCFWHKIPSHVCPFTVPLTSHGEAGIPSAMISSSTSMKDDLGSCSWPAARLGLLVGAMSKVGQDPVLQNKSGKCGLKRWRWLLWERETGLPLDGAASWRVTRSEEGA
ncbi:uncharacterized protein LOC129737219 [Falco cherrug]|uniref:uncharacterized protein LOC129737219 n=1 Tax=Falco cherrug TaxID=345164 RepID=UPI0024787562|nr:uncharacterized protein LOC129737219 [Falco cherrug]